MSSLPKAVRVRAAARSTPPSRANSRASAAPMPDEAPVMKTALPANRRRRRTDGALGILKDDRLFGECGGGLGLADRVAVVSLRLGVFVVGFGLDHQLLRLVDQLAGLGRHFPRFRLLDEILRLFDHHRAVVGPGYRAGEDKSCGYEQDDDGLHACLLL